MTDPVVLTKEEEEAKKEKPFIEQVREKSFSDILKEQSQPTIDTEAKPTQPTDEDTKKEEDEKAAKEAQEAKEKIEAEEADKKRQEDIAAKAAQDVIEKQKAEEQAKTDKLKAEEDEKKRQEDLKPKFTGKDAEGKIVPASYEELTAESVRIAEELAKQEIRAELQAEKEQAKAEQDKATQTVEQQKAQQKAFEDQLQKELDTDLNDLYAAGKLPKVTDPKNENDIGNREFKNLFETAQKVNAERMAKGEAPIRSIKLIYYEHYKPLEKPAGHDAPVFGNESPLGHEAPDDRYIPSRDRNKSMAQLVKEEAQRLSRKLNIRGN